MLCHCVSAGDAHSVVTKDALFFLLFSFFFFFFFSLFLLLPLSHQNLRLLLSGSKHDLVVKIRTDPLCPACGEQEETSCQLCHLLKKGYAQVLARHSIMELEELGKVRPTILYQLERATCDPRSYWGCTLG